MFVNFIVIISFKGVPCPDNKNLMAQMVHDSYNTWSDCTKQQIDAEFERRNKAGQNCFLT